MRFDSFLQSVGVILGKAQKYVGNAHGTGVNGWEINFKPMETYGEFEEMIKWFKETLKNAGKLFQAPGHQRIVFLSLNLSIFHQSRNRGERIVATKNE